MAIFRIPVTITYNGGGGPGVNVWHAEAPQPVNLANLTAIGDILETFYTGIQTLVPTGVTFASDGVATDVQTGEQESFPPFSITASSTVGYAPAATALCVTWRTGTALRSGVGRTFLSPIKTASVDSDGTPTTAALTTVRNACASLLSANATTFADGEGGLGVYSRTTGAIRQFQTARVRDTFAVLRSRRD